MELKRYSMWCNCGRSERDGIRAAEDQNGKWFDADGVLSTRPASEVADEMEKACEVMRMPEGSEIRDDLRRWIRRLRSETVDHSLLDAMPTRQEVVDAVWKTQEVYNDDCVKETYDQIVAWVKRAEAKQQTHKCSTCHGKGKNEDKSSWTYVKCPDCNGTGKQ